MADTKIASIDPRRNVLTLVNIYEVEPERQAELVQALTETTEQAIRHHDGFVSACIHRSLDGTKVVNYAQWASKQHFDAFVQQPASRELLARFAGIAKSVAPTLCTVDAVHTA